MYKHQKSQNLINFDLKHKNNINSGLYFSIINIIIEPILIFYKLSIILFVHYIHKATKILYHCKIIFMFLSMSIILQILL